MGDILTKFPSLGVRDTKVKPHFAKTVGVCSRCYQEHKTSEKSLWVGNGASIGGVVVQTSFRVQLRLMLNNIPASAFRKSLSPKIIQAEEERNSQRLIS